MSSFTASHLLNSSSLWVDLHRVKTDDGNWQIFGLIRHGSYRNQQLRMAFMHRCRCSFWPLCGNIAANRKYLDISSMNEKKNISLRLSWGAFSPTPLECNERVYAHGMDTGTSAGFQHTIFFRYVDAILGFHDFMQIRLHRQLCWQDFWFHYECIIVRNHRRIKIDGAGPVLMSLEKTYFW